MTYAIVMIHQDESGASGDLSFVVEVEHITNPGHLIGKGDHVMFKHPALNKGTFIQGTFVTLLNPQQSLAIESITTHKPGATRPGLH